MRVLVACEFSGRVRDAFRERGHDAYSCDFLASSSPYHYRKDATSLLRQEWDLVIAHPPCTYLTKMGARWRAADPFNRGLKMLAAVEFFKACLNANAPRVCVENPRLFREVLDRIGEPTQIVCPSMFGDAKTKQTCLWLKGLTPLVPTATKRTLTVGTPGRRDSTVLCPRGAWINYHRSVTSEYLARAMAEQWG